MWYDQRKIFLCYKRESFMRSLFFVLIAMGTITNNSYCAQNGTDQPQLIILNKGGSTKVPKTFMMIDYHCRYKQHAVLGTGKIDKPKKIDDLYSEETSWIQIGTDE